MRLPILVVAVVSAGLLLAACSADPTDRAVGSVTTLGDSLNVGIEPYLDEELEGWDVDHHNQSGRRIAEGVAELRLLGRDVAEVVVVSLGSNDFGSDTATFRQQVDELLALTGRKRCVIWATIWLEGSHPFNDVLRAAARRHANLELAEWAELVENEPALLAFDGIHGSPEGYARRAEQAARIAERCLPTPAPAES